MRYVMSDLHGRYDKFLKMLELINFSKEDELYILGDIFDRGEEPIKILEYIWSSKNIFLIKGNHEYMFEKFYEDASNLNLWFSNGGKNTYFNLIDKGQDFMDNVYRYIKRLPLILTIDNYILTHAGLYLPDNYLDLGVEQILKLQDEDYLLWDRDFVSGDKYIDGYTVILGHTPTITLNEEAKIIFKKGKILIDCGAVFETYNGKLSCLCLDNKKEYYI